MCAVKNANRSHVLPQFRRHGAVGPAILRGHGLGRLGELRRSELAGEFEGSVHELPARGDVEI